VILVDGTAWIEYLRATGHAADLRLTALIETDEPLATSDLAILKVLAGARDDEHRDRLRRLLARCTYLPVDAPTDYERAADLFRLCNAGGRRVRRLPECVTAVVAMRHDIALLHADRSFDVIAEYAPLRIAGPPR
jgi:predicted nucleic acid-binding protein